jgi:hypothetical protein
VEFLTAAPSPSDVPAAGAAEQRHAGNDGATASTRAAISPGLRGSVPAPSPSDVPAGRTIEQRHTRQPRRNRINASGYLSGTARRSVPAA